MITSFYPDFVNAMYHSPLTPVHTSGRRATARRKATSKVTGEAEGEATGKARATNASTKRGRRTCTRLPYSRGRPPHAQPGPSGGRAHRACESNGAGNGGATREHGRGSALTASAPGLATQSQVPGPTTRKSMGQNQLSQPRNGCKSKPNRGGKLCSAGSNFGLAKRIIGQFRVSWWHEVVAPNGKGPSLVRCRGYACACCP